MGATLAQILAYRQLCDVVLWNRTADKAKGIALDLMESAPIEGFDVSIIGTGDFAEIKGSDIVVITAGVPRKEGMSRDDLLKVNADVINSACDGIKQYAPNSTVLVLTNPLDAMVFLAKKRLGFPKERVIGMAGILDSARFAEFISMELKTSVKNVNAMVLGSHGDTMVPLTRYTTVYGVPLDALLPKDRVDALVKRTQNGGAEIIALEKDSSAYYAPASALALMADSILNDRRTVLPCSAYLEGEYGISGIFIGVPVVLGAHGVETIVQLELNDDEKRVLAASAAKIKSLVAGL